MIKILHHPKQHQSHLKTRATNFVLFWVFAISILYPISHLYAALSCSVTTQASCNSSGYTTILRMSGTTNAHGELPSQSNANYNNNVVCCNSTSAIGNSCSGNYQSFARLSAVTNAHIQESNINTYSNNLCLSSTTPGDTITVGHQNTNCTGYDTTIASISSADNAQVGDSAAYTEKLCAKVVPTSLTFAINSNTVALGTITTGTTGIGSHTISAVTNASGGFAISYNGPTLTSGSNTIPVYTSGSSSAGTAGFGINLVSNSTPSVGAAVTQNSGTCGIASGYGTSNTFNFVASTPTVITNVTAPADCVYTTSYVANISNSTASGSYSSDITYIISGTF